MYGYATEGLWMGCYKSDCKPIFEYGPMPGWFIATLVIECLGAVAAIATLGLVVIYLFLAGGKSVVRILAILGSFVAAGIILLGIIIYGATVKDNLSWSYALTIIGGIFYGLTGVLLIVSIVIAKRKSFEPDNSPAIAVQFSDVKPEASKPLKYQEPE